ncbi:lymphoid-restricted membrane protein-like [Rhinatrema bivittatum]|uniref:lymphoid-restricted membrane protein-like n=1 Tax=Rhinatrema bivittatum TaxID=194408 RepID=UPI001127AE68|nr:lymphoid-restricted membrane protein-like [Rhinatrema bivittatum]XP_029456003.1 lymphoid-restricted membrane protein-like [Rhinatrema bivittatum]XP_029456004.1 lymphoid-restricted membrane protein-like [Rhinatrema bivittatum]XP_029456005.1 lymphoid-restricted membrane protein-like [Rhinatrema bivittatum]XP_029456006.1 lymphoid-restricted membrane protein-like [Rhinatrema bivittatum]
MASENGATVKRHNPVESICRKIKTIQMRDQESNPTLQIPKFQSRSYDSPQTSIKKNLEVVLKNRTVKISEKSSAMFSSPFGDSGQAESKYYLPPSFTWNTDLRLSATPSPVTTNKEKDGNLWPLCQARSSSTPLRRKGMHSPFPQTLVSSLKLKNIICEDRKMPSSHSSSSYILDKKSEQDALPSPLQIRLSLNRGGQGMRRVLENKNEMTDVSLICEEDLLDNIFRACDIQRRGKVAVSKIVDYLRHTTNRGTEDSGLDELCNMLDPEKKDISVDLDTYHAIMKEWVEECRNYRYEGTAEETDVENSVFKLQENLIAARMASGMNVTSGSLEALGGDVSKGDLETSDLINCVADLQYHNQKLQEQNHNFKMAMETMEEVSNGLMEEIEELHNQAKHAQQAIAKAKSLKDELEEMKTNLNSSEEKRAHILAQKKQLEKDNLSHINKIATLQEENVKAAQDFDDLKVKVVELSSNIVEFQMQLHEYENLVASKDKDLREKYLHIEELKSVLMEYSSVIETLRIEKAKLENNVQQMQQELISNGLSSPVGYKCKQNMEQMNSLLSELELAQLSPEENVKDQLSAFAKPQSSGNLAQLEPHNTHVPISECKLISSDTSLANITDYLSTISSKQDLKNKEMKTDSEQMPEEESTTGPNAEGYSTCPAPLPSCKMVKFGQNDTRSSSEKETEEEFLRLSLGFTCDLFTLDKRLRLEERSRDLAEENLKKEITNCLKLLESLNPVCEEDNQSQEIIKKLEKSLEFLNQHAARVAWRAEMLGAIHQESRVSKAVEVMIQHVENLKRMYAKEHAELEELKGILQANEWSFALWEI